MTHNFTWICKCKKGLRERWGGVQRADGGRGHVGDHLPLQEWEPFARPIAPVAEEVQTDVDAHDGGPCASSTILTFRPTRLELSTLKQCWHLLEFANL